MPATPERTATCRFCGQPIRTVFGSDWVHTGARGAFPCRDPWSGMCLETMATPARPPATDGEGEAVGRHQVDPPPDTPTAARPVPTPEPPQRVPASRGALRCVPATVHGDRGRPVPDPRVPPSHARRHPTAGASHDRRRPVTGPLHRHPDLSRRRLPALLSVLRRRRRPSREHSLRRLAAATGGNRFAA